MKHHSSPFKWRHYAPDVILLGVLAWQFSIANAREKLSPHYEKVQAKD